MKRYDFAWDFPLPRPHTGMVLGNGCMGVMIWGEQADVLRLTIGRADWWDHRGARQWSAAKNYRDIRRHLQAGDEAAVRAIFAGGMDEGPKHPQLLPVGRFDVHLPGGSVLKQGRLDRHRAVVTIDVLLAGEVHHLQLRLCIDRPLLQLTLPGALRAVRLTARPSYETAGDALAGRGIEPTQKVEKPGITGWTQALPAGDDALAAVARQEAGSVWIATALASAPDAALQGALAQVRGVDDAAVVERLLETTDRWWQQYWQQAPQVRIPDERLQFFLDYNAYRFAAMTCPLGVAAGLQGPWIEDYQLPPWSGDYHFNINVQLCYSPAYPSGRLEHLQPLVRLLQGWMPQLRENARLFAGIEDGLMLPHAVDDRCGIVGDFWTGTIDHGSTAWVGKMLYDLWSYSTIDEPTGSDEFARQVVLPFLRGAMRVYQAMLEKGDDGAYVLPVGVSPEYGGSAIWAWGANASFQLACIHYLCQSLQTLSARLDEPVDPQWRQIEQALPRACVEDGRIKLWKGRDLDETHRHHSHLAALTPFDVISIDDPQWRGVIDRSIGHWIYRGMGLWTGWCMPWAAQIHLRVGNGEMARLVLEICQRVFTNEGHGSLHDCAFSGFTLMGANATSRSDMRREIMQMDAVMGAVTAIYELMLHERRGVHHLFAGCGVEWTDVSFEAIRTAGGFTVSATQAEGRLARLVVRAGRDGVFRYFDSRQSKVREVAMKAGEERSLV